MAYDIYTLTLYKHCANSSTTKIIDFGSGLLGERVKKKRNIKEGEKNV